MKTILLVATVIGLFILARTLYRLFTPAAVQSADSYSGLFGSPGIRNPGGGYNPAMVWG